MSPPAGARLRPLIMARTRLSWCRRLAWTTPTTCSAIAIQCFMRFFDPFGPPIGIRGLHPASERDATDHQKQEDDHYGPERVVAEIAGFLWRSISPA